MSTKENQPTSRQDQKQHGNGIGFSKQAVHTNRRPDQYHTMTEPIEISSPYTFENSALQSKFMEARQLGEGIQRGEYNRCRNPTVFAAEQRIVGMENAEDALLFSSGIAAITTTLMTILPIGSHVVLSEGCCWHTFEFCTEFLAGLGVDCTVVPMGDYQALEDAIQPETRLIFSESPTTPYLRTLDLEKFVAIARKYKVISFVDTTFATPYNIRPLDWGVDLVVHSATKYLGGHNDLLAGVIAGKRELIASIKTLLGIFGGIVDSGNASLLLRGIKTLGLRAAQHNLNGQAAAEFLEGQPKIDRVWYPGLESHPDHGAAVKHMRGFGGVVSFTINGDLDAASQFVEAVRLPLLSASPGGVESLIEQPGKMSSSELSTRNVLHQNLPGNLVKLTLGIEDTNELIAALGKGLDCLSASG